MIALLAEIKIKIVQNMHNIVVQVLLKKCAREHAVFAQVKFNKLINSGDTNYNELLKRCYVLFE